ncbi:MAG: hypothetical protein BGN88_03470 [Clostridiales bacterium 43-6]|nr:MAG: hypothetical protein BGN88_03470 [Clostridiales bacterium 43-6]
MKYGELKKKIRETFFENISDKQLSDIYIYQYIWHAFSYETIDCLKEDKANIEFDRQTYKHAWIFYEDDDFDTEALEIDSTEWKAKDVFDLSRQFGKKRLPKDIYVVDCDFKWIYARTHEEDYGLGPYFYRKKR